MCKPSGSGLTGARTADLVATTAIVVVVLAVIGTVGPAVMAISHVVVDVVKLAAVGIGCGAMLAAAIWITVQLLRAYAVSRPARRLYLTARQQPARLTRVSEQACITCGDTGRITQVIGNGNLLRLKACPDCQPAQLTR